MKAGTIYAILGGLATITLTLLVLWGPGDEPDESESVLWHNDWELIVYHELRAWSEEGPPDATVAVRPDLRLIRDPGFFEDDYYVESPAGGQIGSPIVRRQGAFSVSNIFGDLRSPKLVSYIEDTAENRERCGLNEPLVRIQLGEDREEEPTVELTIGGKAPSNNYYALSNVPEHEGLILIVTNALVQSFQRDYDFYREKRLLYYPADSYTESLVFTGNIASPDGRFSLRQERVLDEQDHPASIWYARAGHGTEREVPTHMAAALEGAARQLQIHYFADDPRAAGRPQANEAWQEAPEIFQATFLILARSQIVIAVRGDLPPAPEAPDPDEVLLIQKDAEGPVDYVQARMVRDILKHLQTLALYVEQAPADEGEGVL